MLCFGVVATGLPGVTGRLVPKDRELSNPAPVGEGDPAAAPPTGARKLLLLIRPSVLGGTCTLVVMRGNCTCMYMRQSEREAGERAREGERER